MPHKNVIAWKKLPEADRGPRPCDWCGCPVSENDIHRSPCPKCKRHCLREEGSYYIDLGEGETPSVKKPEGYEIFIPKGKP